MELVPDTIRTIASYLDDNVLEVVFMSGAMPSLLDISRDQHFWHDRVQTLTGMKLGWINGNWARAYAILKEELAERTPSFVNDEDNSIVTSVLIAMGFDPSVNHNEAIMLAAEEGRLEIVKVLLADSRVDPSNASLFTDEVDALTRATYDGEHLEIIELLLTDPNVNTTEALVNAAYRSLKMVKILLADRRTDPTPALVSSADEGNLDIFKLILQDPRTVRSVSASEALARASLRGHEEIVRILLSLPEVDPSYMDNMAIQNAVTSSTPSVVRLLLTDPRIDPSNYSIVRAATALNFEIIQLLLEDPRVDPTISDSILLRMAVEGDHIDIVDLLLRHPIQDIDDNNRATVRAIAMKHHDLAKMMISSGMTDPELILPNILKNDNREIVKYILSMVTISSSDLSNMISTALDTRQFEVANLLIQQPNAAVEKIFSESIRAGRLNQVRLLLGDKRLDPSEGSELDFIEAAKRGHVLVIVILLRDGRIDPTFNNNQALREAIIEGRSEVIRLLLADSRVQQKQFE